MTPGWAFWKSLPIWSKDLVREAAAKTVSVVGFADQDAVAPDESCELEQAASGESRAVASRAASAVLLLWVGCVGIWWVMSGVSFSGSGEVRWRRWWP